jgi:hypothetical protein
VAFSITENIEKPRTDHAPATVQNPRHAPEADCAPPR